MPFSIGDPSNLKLHHQKGILMPEKQRELIDFHEVLELTGLTRELYRSQTQRGQFPKPRTLAPTSSGWLPRWARAEVEVWVKERKSPTPVNELRTTEDVCSMCNLTRQELDQKVRGKQFPLPRLHVTNEAPAGPRWALGDIHEWILNRQGVA
jgi:predicted DNA-binding transcriptional regulator AlpA